MPVDFPIHNGLASRIAPDPATDLGRVTAKLNAGDHFLDWYRQAGIGNSSIHQVQFAGHRRVHQRAGEQALAVHPTGNFVQSGKQSCKGNIQTLETEGTLNATVVRVRIQVHIQREIAKLGSGKTDRKVGLSRLQADLGCQGIVGE